MHRSVLNAVRASTRNTNPWLWGAMMALFVAAFATQTKVAKACSGDPPIVPCSLQMSCGFASAKIYPLPRVSALTTQSGNVKLNGLVHISSFNPDCQNCPGLDKLVFDFSVDCSALVEVQGDGVQDTFNKTYEITDPKYGINEVDVAFGVKLFEPSEFNPMKQPKFKGGVCEVKATATLYLDNGAQITSECKDGQVCFVPTLDKGGVSKPVLEIVALNKEDDEPGSNNSIGYPGEEQVLRYKVINNAGGDFQGALNIESDNINVKAVASNLPEGVDPSTYTFGLSEGDGDDFVVGQSISMPDNECLPLPQQPGQSISPSSGTKVPDIPSGGEFIFEVFSNTWGNCGDGSCSQANLSITGTVAGTPVKLCLTGNFMTSATTEAAGNTCVGQPATPMNPLCTEAGQQDGGDGCSQDPFCDPEVPLGVRAPLPGADGAGKAPQGKRQVPSLPHDRFPVKEGVIGASFSLTGGKHALYVIKASDSEWGEAGSSELKEQRVDHNLVRVLETVTLDETLAASDTVSVKVPFAVVQRVGEDRSTPKLTVGSKDTPGSEALNTFIALSNVYIDSKPGIRAELMSQVTAWVLEDGKTRLVPAPLKPISVEATETGMLMSFELTAPVAGKEIQVAYDFRSYSQEEEEKECDDKTDNDGDGKTDCEDPDCAGHPSCADTTSGAGGAGGGGSGVGGSGGSAAPGGGDDEGCSCRVAGGTSGGPTRSAWLFAGLAAAALLRRRSRS